MPSVAAAGGNYLSVKGHFSIKMNVNKRAQNGHSMIGIFKNHWLEASGEYITVAADDDLTQALFSFINESNITSVVIAGPPLSLKIGEFLSGKVDILADFGRVDYDRNEARNLCNEAQAGISGVDALIADTGALVIVSHKRGDRLISSLPDFHLVVASDVQIFRTQEDYLKTAPTNKSFCFITGPSRTADIEKRLVLGAHGPKRVVVFGITP